MRPACAIATTSASISSIASAGRTSTRTRASSSPALAKPCTTPGATSTTSPGPARRRRRPRRKRMRPATTSKRSVWIGWTWGMGTAPPGRSASSKASSSPPVLARGVGEGEALAGDRVLEGLAWSDHAASQYRLRETVHGRIARLHARASTIARMDAVAGLARRAPRARGVPAALDDGPAVVAADRGRGAADARRGRPRRGLDRARRPRPGPAGGRRRRHRARPRALHGGRRPGHRAAGRDPPRPALHDARRPGGRADDGPRRAHVGQRRRRRDGDAHRHLPARRRGQPAPAARAADAARPARRRLGEPARRR